MTRRGGGRQPRYAGVIRSGVDQDGFELIVRQAGRELLGSGQRRQPGAPFYHYATADGLSGILETQTIWATDYRFLNDTEEVERGERAVQAEIASVIQAYPEDTVRGFLCRQIEEIRHGHRLSDIAPIYVVSFSNARDHLGQWRAYGDDAQGYALGFKSLPLPVGEQVPVKLDAGLGVDFGPCIYDIEEFRALVRETLFFTADGLEKYTLTYCHSHAEEQRIRKQALSSALANVGTLAPFLKDPAYTEEKECRLMYIGTAPEPELFSRKTIRYGMAPYIKVDLRKGARMDLQEIIAGPRVDSLDFLKSTAERLGYGNVSLSRSRIPYR